MLKDGFENNKRFTIDTSEQTTHYIDNYKFSLFIPKGAMSRTEKNMYEKEQNTIPGNKIYWKKRKRFHEEVKITIAAETSSIRLANQEKNQTLFR